MRRALLSYSKAARPMSRTFARSAGEATPSSLDSWSKGTTAAVGGLTIVGAIGGGGYWLHTVDAKLLAQKKVLEGAIKEMDAKMAGVEKAVTKEVDAKMAGVSDKAKAEALMVLKEYGVSAAGCSVSLVSVLESLRLNKRTV